jgi:hypothetical protein
LLGGEEASLFVSVPLSVRIFASGDRPLVDVPSQRLTDTWFGPSTRVGDSATRAHQGEAARGRAPLSPHLAICRVRLANHAQSPLVVDRLSLPVNHLDLWAHRDRGLWTRAIEVERAADGSLASVRLGRGRARSKRQARCASPPPASPTAAAARARHRVVPPMTRSGLRRDEELPRQLHDHPRAGAVRDTVLVLALALLDRARPGDDGASARGAARHRPACDGRSPDRLLLVLGITLAHRPQAASAWTSRCCSERRGVLTVALGFAAQTSAST